MNRETDDRKFGQRDPARLGQWLRRAALATILVLTGTGIAAVSLWTYRAPVLAWFIKNRIAAQGATAALSVTAFDVDRLAIQDIRLHGAADVFVKSLELKYDLEDFLRGRVTGVNASNLTLIHKGFRADIKSIAGDGIFAFGIWGIRRLQADLDVVGATFSGERIQPSRVSIDYRDDSLVLETTVQSSRGFIAVIGEGSLAKGAPPYGITLSGRLDSNLFPFLVRTHSQGDAISFILNTEIADLANLFRSIRRGRWYFPERFTATGELELDLGRMRVAGHALGTPGRDRIRFRFNDLETQNGITQGEVGLNVDIASRRISGFGFTRANVTVDAKVRLSRDKIDILLNPGSETSVLDVTGVNGFHLRGKTAFRLFEGNNQVSVDIPRRSARHRLVGRLIRKDGELRLQSEGDLSSPDDPIVFTLQGKIDTAPLLALLSDIHAKSGIGEIFVAGEATSLFPQPNSTDQSLAATSGSLRLDGAATLHVKGTALPGIEKTNTSADQITVALKGFEISRNWRRGRIALTAKLAARRFGSTHVRSGMLSLDGQFRSTAHGYVFRLEPSSVLQLDEIRDGELVVPGGVRLQLAGEQNLVETDAEFRPTSSRLRFEHLEARGTYDGQAGKPEAFRLSLPTIDSQFGENGQEISADEGTFTLPGLFVAAKDISMNAHIGVEGVSAALTAGDVRHRDRRPLWSPVAISARATLKENAVNAAVQVQQLRTPLAANATIQHDFNLGSGRFRFMMPHIGLEGPRHGFGDMFPVALGWFDHIRGGVTADGEIHWDRDQLAGRATVTADKVALALQDLRIRDMSGTVEFIKLKPLLMPPRQRVTGNLAFHDVGPLPFQAAFQLNEDGNFVIQDLDFEVEGGHLRTRGNVKVGDTAISGSGEVSMTAIALQDALHLLGIDGIDAEGRVTGKFPIILRNNVPRILGGRLSADKPGRLRLRGGNLQKQLIGAPDTKAAALRVLSDFRFSSLVIDLDTLQTGAGIIALRMNGDNPAVSDGKRFDFELRIAGDTRRLERLALGGVRTSSDVSRQAEKR